MFIQFQIAALILSLIWNPLKCSLVIDAQSQKGIHISDYCPKTEYCEEGAHVMCMYYDPKRVHGPRCSNPQNVSMTPDLAMKLLDVTNAVRSRIALGKEKGKDGALLPRGYGIFRLSWDEELATFAQVLANTCIVARDMCRATKRFPRPGQGVGSVKFSYPNWMNASKMGHFSEEGLNAVKLNYAITRALKTWYEQKRFIDADQVTNYPDWDQGNVDPSGRLYLNLITGSQTHMGCGLSAFSDYAYHDNYAHLNYNTVQVVCNFSERPSKGTQVYTMTPPTKVGYTVRCGCPPGYNEDFDCLCYESPSDDISAPKPYCDDKSCKPSVVLLPIFTMEDAPPHKLLPRGFHNNTARIGKSAKIRNRDGNYRINARILEPRTLNDFSKLLRSNDLSRPPLESNSLVLQHHFFEEPRPPGQLERYAGFKQPSHLPKNHMSKQSIFSRAAKFHLPTSKITNSYRASAKEIKKDVAPRKDFSNVRRLLTNYLSKKRSRTGNVFKESYREHAENEPSKPWNYVQYKNPKGLSQKNDNRKFNPYGKPKFHYGDFNLTRDQIKRLDIGGLNEESDKKLMSLLDNLEQEVKHVELGQIEKDIFDAKIRKIYGTVVGKQEFLPKSSHSVTRNRLHNREIDENLINYEIAADNKFLDNEHFKDEQTVRKLKPDNPKINQNSLRSYRNKSYRTRNPTNNAVENIEGSISFRDRDIETRDYKINNRYDDDTRNNDFQIRMDSNDDQLGYDRRKYYQERLDRLERKLHNARNNHHRSVNPPRQVRPVLPTTNNEHPRPSKEKQNLDTFYVPDRARFLHGF